MTASPGGFRFALPKAAKWPEARRAAIQFTKYEENLPTDLQGKAVDSKEEARLGTALGLLDWRYYYQYELFGGSLRGGLFLDFLIFLAPRPAPVFVLSSFYHGGIRRNAIEFDMQKVKRARPDWRDPVGMWDYELPTVEAAYDKLVATYGRH